MQSLVIILLSTLICTSFAGEFFHVPDDMNDVTRLRDQQFLTGFPKEDDGNNWIVMYYSPTCPICKAMMPLMADLSVASDALKDEVDSSREFKVGIVDCQKSKFACGRAKVKQYPHIMHTTNGKKGWIEFKGDKSLHALKFTAHRAMNPGRHIQPLKTYREVQDVTKFGEGRAGGIKVVLSTDDPDGPAIRTYRELVGLAASFTTINFFVFVRDKAKTKIILYNDVGNDEYADINGSASPPWSAEDIREWLVPRRFLAVEDFTRENMHEISHQPGKRTAMLIHDSSKEEEHKILLRAMRDVAKKEGGKYLQNFTMGVLPGQFWKEWLDEHSISEEEFPLLVVAHAEWGTFYRNTTTEGLIREAAKTHWIAQFSTSMSDFLDTVNDGTALETAGFWTLFVRWFYGAGLVFQIGTVILFIVLIIISLAGCLTALDGPPPPARKYAPSRSAPAAKRGGLPKSE